MNRLRASPLESAGLCASSNKTEVKIAVEAVKNASNFSTSPTATSCSDRGMEEDVSGQCCQRTSMDFKGHCCLAGTLDKNAECCLGGLDRKQECCRIDVFDQERNCCPSGVKDALGACCAGVVDMRGTCCTSGKVDKHFECDNNDAPKPTKTPEVEVQTDRPSIPKAAPSGQEARELAKKEKQDTDLKSGKTATPEPAARV